MMCVAGFSNVTHCNVDYRDMDLASSCCTVLLLLITSGKLWYAYYQQLAIVMTALTVQYSTYIP